MSWETVSRVYALAVFCLVIGRYAPWWATATIGCTWAVAGAFFWYLSRVDSRPVPSQGERADG